LCLAASLLPSIGDSTAKATFGQRGHWAYLSLRMRRNLLYDRAVPSSKLLHQLHEFEQVLEAKEASATGHCHKWIFRRYRGPTRRNRAQLARRVMEVDTVLAPVIAICDQFVLLSSQRMMRMGYLEVGIGKVTMWCS
jgi:hypothetical protein